MNLPPNFTPHNKRSIAMWEHISQHVDFTGKSVLDVGSGYGDHSFYAHLSGARVVYGMDKDLFIAKSASLARDTYFPTAKVYFIQRDAETWSERWPGRHDIVMCFSLLPYLQHPRKLLSQIFLDCSEFILETQYLGDGPGLTWCRNDDDMDKTLEGIGWDIRLVIGKTTVIGRDKERSIWLCKKLS